MEQDGKITVYMAVRSSDVQTSTVDESGKKKHGGNGGNIFLCPKDTQVVVGRMHLGDENGETTYKYGDLSFLGRDSDKYEFKLSDVFYSAYMEEKDSKYTCPDGALIVGREHAGDENGQTRYAYKKLYGRKRGAVAAWMPCKLSKTFDCVTKESSGLWAEAFIPSDYIETTSIETEKTYYAPMYAREHEGDENGKTTTHFALCAFELCEKSESEE